MRLSPGYIAWWALACVFAACSGQHASGSGDDRNDAGTGGETGGLTGSTNSPHSGGAGGSSAHASSGTGGANSGSGAATSGDSGAAARNSAGSGAGGSSGVLAGTSGTSSSAAGASGNVSVPGPGDLFAAPDGKDSAAGTIADPLSLTAALAKIRAGSAIYARGGTYAYSAQITIARDNAGSDGKLKRLLSYDNEKPLLDFSSEPYGSGSNPRGLQIDGSYWHVRGLEVKDAADNGIYISGSNNIIEGCVTHGNRDTGLQLGRYASSAAMSEWPSNNLILNCESYDNYDAPPGSGENADGFAAKLTVGSGNLFRGCVARNNIDDGWDLYTKSDTGPIGAVTIDQCIAHHNGTLTGGTTSSAGDRNGFKLGGEKIPVAHVVTRSVAFANGATGFTWNSNPGAIRLSNTLAFDNGAGNYKFGDNSTTTQAVFTNNVSLWTTSSGQQSDKTVGTDVSSSNCWWNTGSTPKSVNGKGLQVGPDDFAHALTSPAIARNPDGSIDCSPFALKPDSDLINAGVVPQGPLPFDASYYHGMPELGVLESP